MIDRPGAAARLGVGIAALGAVALALWQLLGAFAGLEIVPATAGTVPVTVFRPAAAPRGPAVVVAHGFAGSQQLMQPFATTLARNGYTAITFDFPGHGRHPAPLPGGLEDHRSASAALLATLDTVAAFARAEGDGRTAVLGHSMASEIVVRYAVQHPDVTATVGVSLFSPDVTPLAPRNLLVIVGALEPSMLKDEGRRIVGMATAGDIRDGVTYGNMANGSARRLAFARGVEHIGVLYSRDSLRETVEWLDLSFGRNGVGYLERRGPWLLLLFAGIVGLARTLFAWLPTLAPHAPLARTPWKRWWPVVLAPPLLTPLLLWKAPTAFLPLLLGDYLMLHFCVYGILTAAGLRLARLTRPEPVPAVGPSRTKLAWVVLAATTFAVLAVAWPMDRFVSNFLPVGARLPLLAAMLCGTLPWFLADEWLTRRADAPRAAYFVTKTLFLASLVFAIGLNLQKLFFLIIIVPAILAFFLVYGLFSRWAYRATGSPLVGAIANAVAFAWAIAVTFPVVAR